ncbi:MAG: carboxymuconolactone decarboxylase family protein [Agitococcus sp.]|jgi:alkylhydroperoxidase family enzyme|nr:carboxymuconolactone decarboxylase family protein [Agitococcus sp.]
MKEAIELAPPKGWIRAEKVRILPITEQESAWHLRSLNSAINRLGKLQASNLFMTLMGNFRIFSRWILFASSLMPYGELKRRETELIILRVAWNCRCQYEWAQHKQISQQVGLTEHDLLNVTIGSDGFPKDSCEALLMLSCDEFHHQRMISEKTWQMLTRFYSDKDLLEILMVIGHYEMLAGILNSTGIAVDDHLISKNGI